MGFFEFVAKLNKLIKVELQIKSKWGVSPLMTHPKAMKPSKRFKFLEIITGISNVPGTLIIRIFFFFNF